MPLFLLFGNGNSRQLFSAVAKLWCNRKMNLKRYPPAIFSEFACFTLNLECHRNTKIQFCWFFFVDAYPSFDPMLDGRKEIAKYNRFMDEIFTRMNIAIKAKQLDPMDLKLLPTNSDKVPRSGAIYDNVQKVRFSFKIHLGVFLTIWYFTGQSLVTWHVNLKTNWWCLHILSCKP